MTRIGIILGSTRPGRRADRVGDWVLEVAGRHPLVLAGTAEVAVVDPAEYRLPLLDEPEPAAWGGYRHAHTTAWAATIDSFDGFVFVTPEYNHSVSGALKNAIDFLYREWHDKAAGCVGYGAAGAIRAVEHLRQILGEVGVATVRTQVALDKNTATELFTDPDAWSPSEAQAAGVNLLLEEVVTLSQALRQRPIPAR
ncbi:NADPH-dependent FMN reductase [Amycolatopsis cihanbeyliensis]|uniref:NAD(P)H-dependent FMN reductase n=1 Tax=Amycolatopsis cihanbeyliensis TaxID=1128664 RepID=A0A542DRV7_AMYCI|nr:NAD(P)H-dependent oxidoreductase [Amycolatopsis cihanbeyliensis]TQJ05851.1 NAD(P)H-dependent FMN reductase [Amycolatopsis cihanbeyliensis]